MSRESRQSMSGCLFSWRTLSRRTFTRRILSRLILVRCILVRCMVVLFPIALGACSAAPTPTPTATLLPSATAVPFTPTPTVYLSPTASNTPIPTWTPTVTRTPRRTDTPLPAPTELDPPTVTPTPTAFAGTFGIVDAQNNIAIELTFTELQQALVGLVGAPKYSGQFVEARSIVIRGRTIIATFVLNDFTPQGLLVEASITPRIVDGNFMMAVTAARNAAGVPVAQAQRQSITDLLTELFDSAIFEQYRRNASGSISVARAERIIFETDRLVLLAKVIVDRFTPTAVITPVATLQISPT